MGAVKGPESFAVFLLYGQYGSAVSYENSAPYSSGIRKKN